MKPPGQTPEAREAFSALVEARVMLETGWTWDELLATPEPVLWLVTTVMGMDGEKAREPDRKPNIHRRPLA